MKKLTTNIYYIYIISIYIYIIYILYICIYKYIIYIYIYIYLERERQTDRERESNHGEKTTYLKNTFRSLEEGRGTWESCPLFFLNHILPGRFSGKLLLCNYPRHPKLFWPQHSQNFVGGLYVVWKNSYSLTSSGYGYSNFPLTHVSS